MGSPTPVNLSNGEFQLSPDQVHSVGVQTLDAMKNQTHMPVDQPQLGLSLVKINLSYFLQMVDWYQVPTQVQMIFVAHNKIELVVHKCVMSHHS
jgi:hypothetical protein